jgi:hypothetical protein
MQLDRRVGEQVTRLGAQGFLAGGQPEHDACLRGLSSRTVVRSSPSPLGRLTSVAL